MDGQQQPTASQAARRRPRSRLRQQLVRPRRRDATGERLPARDHREPERLSLFGPNPDHPVDGVNGTGQMTVVSPDTTEGTVTVSGHHLHLGQQQHLRQRQPVPEQRDGPLPPNGVVFVENAPTEQTQAWANPLDDPAYNTATNLTSSPTSPQAGEGVTLTATVTSNSNRSTTGQQWPSARPPTTPAATRTAVINSCSAVTLSAPVAVVPATTPAPRHRHLLLHRGQQRDRGVLRRLLRRRQHRSSRATSARPTRSAPSVVLRSRRPGHRGRLLQLLLRQTSSPDAEGDAFVNGMPVRPADHRHGQQRDHRRQHHLRRLQLDDRPERPQCGLQGLSLQPGRHQRLPRADRQELRRNRAASPGLPARAGNPTIAPYCAAKPAATCDPSNGSTASPSTPPSSPSPSRSS